MKVIDILNKIANGEEVPKKIKYDNDIWYYDKIAKDYLLTDKSGEEYLICEELNLMFALNEEVEIIEEDKKIEKIKILNCDDYVKKENYETILTMQEIALDIQTLKHKINEIIDYLKEKEC